MKELKEAFTLLGDKLLGWYDQLVLLIPNIVLAILFFSIVLFISGYAKRYSLKLLQKVSNNTAVNRLGATLFTAIFMVMGIFMTLSILGLDKAVTSLLAGAGVIGLAVGLAFQDPIMNTISGIIMSLRSPFNIGDLVETNDHFGTIHKISLRSTILDTPQGERVIIPNKSVLQEPFKNYSLRGMRRVDLECGVSYGDDLEQVQGTAVEAIQNGVKYFDKKPVQFFYKSFGDSSVNFVVRYWINETKQADYLQAQHEGIIALKKAFDQNSISIPFPIRTLDFDAKGGKELKTMLGSLGQKINGKKAKETVES